MTVDQTDFVDRIAIAPDGSAALFVFGSVEF
jgi:hypothetical protein